MILIKNTIIFISLVILLSIQNITGSSESNRNNECIIFIGDIQKTSKLEFWREKNDGISKLLMEKIASEDPHCVVLLGDMVFQGSSAKTWKIFDSEVKKLKEKHIPVYPALGNHEYFGNNKTAFKLINSRFPFFSEKTWYSVKIKSIGIILLNSNFNQLTKEQNTEQINWYENELKKFQQDSTISCIISASHHPPFTNSKAVQDSKEVQEYFVKPFLNSKKPGIYFSGHCHSYEHFINGDKHFIVSGGGGGPRQELNTEQPGKVHNDLFKGPSLRDFNYCKLSFTETGILFQVIMLDKEGNFKIGEAFTINN